jgi:hypothetical protein
MEEEVSEYLRQIEEDMENEQDFATKVGFACEQ